MSSAEECIDWAKIGQYANDPYIKRLHKEMEDVFHKGRYSSEIQIPELMLNNEGKKRLDHLRELLDLYVADTYSTFVKISCNEKQEER